MKDRLRLLPPLLLAALPLILYAPLLLGGQVLYWGVYLLQFYPWRRLAVEQIGAGHWPLWNPYLGAGTPLAANLQTAVFYPPNLLFLLLPIERAFTWELALHVALAGLFAYYLGRTLGLRRFGALIGALAYAGGGYLITRWVFPSMVYAAAWLPLMLALAERLQRTVGPPAERLLYVIFLALTIALQLLAGHAQTSFYSLVIVGLFALYRLLQQPENGEPPGRTRRRLTAAFYLAVAGLWGLALAAIQLLPTAELAAHSQRAGTLTDLRFALELSFWPWRLITLLAPDFFGNPAHGEYWAYGNYWEGAAYIGLLPLLLALLAAVSWWKKRKANSAKAGTGPLRLVPFFALLSLVSLLLALGNRTPLYPILFRCVPGFGLFQAPARLLIGYALGMALLAGSGADTLSITPRVRAMLRLAVVAGLGIGSAGALARLLLPAVRADFGNSAARLGLGLALAAGALLLGRQRLRDRRWQALIVALVAADLLAFGRGLAPGTSPAVYQAPVTSAQYLQAQPPGRVFVAYPYAQEVYDEYVSLRTFGDNDPAYLRGLRESLSPNLNAIHHLSSVGNYDPLTVGLYRDLWDRLQGERDEPPSPAEVRPLLDLFGVRYVVGDPAWAQSGLPLLYDAGPHIYRNDTALPEAWIVPRARVVEDPQARLAALLDPAFDPRAEVLLSRAPDSAPPASGAESGQVVWPEPVVSRPGPDRVDVRVDMAQPGYLVLADTYYPGWQATVDGRPAEILPANHAFRTLALAAGRHEVRFEYRPASFRWGAWISLAAGLALATGLVLAAVRRYRRRS